MVLRVCVCDISTNISKVFTNLLRLDQYIQRLVLFPVLGHRGSLPCKVTHLVCFVKLQTLEMFKNSHVCLLHSSFSPWGIVIQSTFFFFWGGGGGGGACTVPVCVLFGWHQKVYFVLCCCRCTKKSKQGFFNGWSPNSVLGVVMMPCVMVFMWCLVKTLRKLRECKVNKAKWTSNKWCRSGWHWQSVSSRFACVDDFALPASQPFQKTKSKLRTHKILHFWPHVTPLTPGQCGLMVTRSITVRLESLSLCLTVWQTSSFSS